jgi:hypothetical protein
MLSTIFIVPIEPIDQRYTAQWYENIPKILNEAIQKHQLQRKVVTIHGEEVSKEPTAGAFLDFTDTNSYKASQVVSISKKFKSGEVKAGDKFLVTDAWNFATIAIKYMSELLNIPVEIHSIWHAGNYDPSDILGMKMSKGWASNLERSLYYASDYNYFGTNFHLKMFEDNLAINRSLHKSIRSGQPHSPIIDLVSQYNVEKKDDIVIFPHRYNEDKQPNIAEHLRDRLDVPLIITQPMKLSKSNFYDLLGKSKVVLSCSLHENLGISMMEGVLAGAIPIVPDRCSYSEMYLPDFKYPSEWTESFESYMEHKELLKLFITNRMQNYDALKIPLMRQRQILEKHYLNASIMVNNLLTFWTR